MRYRPRVTGLLILLFAITYIDRVCISVAGPRMQEDLGIDPVGWGWVTAMFTLSYCLFEIPTGALGDRIGPRRVLTRVVLWWSAFTSLTGAVSNYYLLLLTRFCFGAGEAGAFPNASIVVSRWYPPSQRASMAGVLLMASQIGGAIAPLLVVPIQIRYGWRASFFVFGAVGLIWAAVWYAWFSDSPAEKPGVSQEEINAVKAVAPIAGHGFPWRIAFRSETVLAMMGTAFCYVYVYSFFQTWFHTFLIRDAGSPRRACCCRPCRTRSRRARTSRAVPRVMPWSGAWARSGAGGRSALADSAARVCLPSPPCSREHQLLTLILLSLVYGGITFQQAGVFGVCLDIGGKHAGSMVGLMNTSAQVGAFLSSIAFGYIVERFHSYNAPFVPMAAVLFLGALLWLKIDASKEVSQESLVVAVPATAV